MTNKSSLRELVTREILIRRLRSEERESAASPRLSHQPRTVIRGGRAGWPSLFCIPGAGASVTSFVALSNALKSDIPVYGLQPRGLDGTQPPYLTVREAAAAYVPVLLEERSDVPIHIVGHSFGGWIAYELGAQLRMLGARVDSVLLIDSRAALPQTLPLSDEDVLRKFVGLFQMSHPAPLGDLVTLMLGSSIEVQMAILRENLIEARVLSKGVDVPSLIGAWRVFEANVRAEFIPQGHFDGRFILAQAEQLDDQERTDRRENECWWNGVRTLSETWCIPGNHITMLTSVGSQALARRIHDRILQSASDATP